ncbi:hypothetical protein FEZ18_04015 [Oceanihabitans sp. IOP_32]|uniref:WD40/YVTN/BNR-like repeat-containing protein n=1 Tax=Oceanihabitans sp. IOP_32 TaxID=2529032 RepID=UPI001293DD80|nr:hypothetical protein [Oceanihabitans sp. IOP_32]QFZ54030.1 hypothetical protein FEZ18_04015 [Oceanihabitans sp. IOP_32]
MKKLTLLLFITSTLLSAQTLDLEKLKNMKPRSIGPAGMSGRITAIDAVNSNPKIIYVGAASGGVWKSESGGVDWKPIFDKQPIQSIGALAIQQSNPDVIWVGTGEGNPRNSLNGGYGIYKSLDAGATWHLMGLEKTRNIHRIIIDKDNPNTVYVAAIGSPWGEHPERGVYKTTDGGKTWTKSLFVNNKTGAADLVVDATNPNKLIAAMWEHRRKPWTFNSGGEGSGLYITYDGGENWIKKTDKDGLPKGVLGRIGIAISPSNPKIVYALIESKKNALYKSEDGGTKWKMINDKDEIGDRPFYYSDLFVDAKNENRLYTIFTYVNVSDDGGKSFKQLMPAYNSNAGIHPDHHAWYIHPENPDFMIDGNDGGLNITHDKGKTWRFVGNLPIGQFYHINYDMEYPYNLYGGMQDNGSWVGPAYVLKAQGIRNSYWQELMFGDGFDVIPDPKNSRYGYGMSQQGYVGRYDRETGRTKMIRPTHPDPEIKLRFNWNAAIAMDPFDSETLYFGSQFVHKTTNKGHEWDVISPDLTTNDPEKQKQHESGGITMDATGAENHTTILAITPSTLEKGLLWVGTDDGQIQLTRNDGETWTNVTPLKHKKFIKGSWIAQIKASTFNAGEAYAVINNYRNFDFKPYLFRTRDYGKTWESLLDTKDETFGYSLALIQDPIEKNLLFLGTENGLYVSLDEAKTWTKWTNNYPSVSTMDLGIHPREHDLVIGTFGRSMYVLDDIRPLRTLAKEGSQILNDTLKVYDSPNAFISLIQQPSGSRFGGNALFNGENRSIGGASINYSINKPTDTLKTKKSDSITVKVFNVNNDLIRTLKQKAPKESGLQKASWNLDEKGVNGPSRKIAKKDAPEPSGVGVLPGDYKVVIQYRKHKDSTTIKVAYDPRVEMPFDVLKSKYDLQKQLEKQFERMGKTVTQFIESKKIANTYKKQFKDINAKQYKDAINKSDSIVKSIDGLIDAIMGKEDKRQGITRNPEPTPLNFLNTARRYVGSLQEKPGKTQMQLIKNADEKVNEIMIKTDNFFMADWPEYRANIEDTKFTLFKD